jgi:hypothetical protein
MSEKEIKRVQKFSKQNQTKNKQIKTKWIVAYKYTEFPHKAQTNVPPKLHTHTDTHSEHNKSSTLTKKP